MTGLRTTFYSYKGGVGRTLALLNVGALLASNRRKVVAVDLDLEAPGFGLSTFTRRDASGPGYGISDFLQDRLRGGREDLHDFCYRVPPDRLPDQNAEFYLLPVGTQPGWLTAEIPQFYRDPASDAAELFLLLLDEIEAALAPDFIFFDSCAGRADIAGVALLELPQVIVAISALNEQNLNGLREVLEQLRAHPARRSNVLTLLALSHVPTMLLAEAKDDWPLSAIPDLDQVSCDPREDLLLKRIASAQAELLAPLQNEFALEVQKWFPDVSDRDLLHILPYDPIVPLTGELQIVHTSELARAYGRLAHVIALARPGDGGLPHLVTSISLPAS